MRHAARGVTASGFRGVCQVRGSESLTSRFFSIFDLAMVGIAYTRANGTILEANRKFCEMLGYTATELNSLTTSELTHADDRHRHEQLSLELIGSKRLSISDEQRFVRKNGEPLWIKRMASRVEETSSEQPYLVEVVQDVTARIDLEQRFR